MEPSSMADGNALWATLATAQKGKQRATMTPSNPSSGYIPERTHSRYSNKNLYPNIPSSASHNRRKAENNIPRWMNGQNQCGPSHDGILPSHEQEGSMGTSSEHTAKGETSDT